jgi:hypothetical protein
VCGRSKRCQGLTSGALLAAETYISLSRDPVAVTQHFVTPLLTPVIANYGNNVAGARESEVLTLMSRIIKTCRDAVTEGVPQMLAPVFHPTIEMITPNFEDYPEIRCVVSCGVSALAPFRSRCLDVTTWTGLASSS